MRIKRLLSKILVFFIHKWALLFYEEKYLQGKCFPNDSYGIGWSKVVHCWFQQKVRGFNRNVPWPVPEHVQVGNPQNIEFDVDEIANFWSVGCYYQALGAKLKIGKGTIIAPGVGLITSNHDLNNYNQIAKGKDVIIGDNCWIGMNSVILPGVILGDHTVVGAGSVVTKSFPEGYCIIVGNPARKIKEVKTNENNELFSEKIYKQIN